MSPDGTPSLALAARTQVEAFVDAVRPRQWIKNAFVLAPLIFSGNVTDWRAVQHAFLAGALFCVGASLIYVLNDLHDLPADRLHPVKRRTRPFAAGRLTTVQGWALIGGLLAVLTLGSIAQPTVTLVILGYVLLNVAYTLRLKHVPVVCLFVLAAGFVLRVYAGAVAIGVPLSSWMLVTTFSLALFLVVTKRRDELAHTGPEARPVLRHYSVALLDRFGAMSAVCAVVFYSLFVMTNRPQLVMTIPLVLFGLFRYWLIVDQNGRGESPTETFLGDMPLAATIIVWGIVCALAIPSA